MFLQIVELLDWMLIVGAIFALVWLVRRTVDRDRVMSEVEAYGQAVDADSMPNLTVPAACFFGLLAAAVLFDIVI